MAHLCGSSHHLLGTRHYYRYAFAGDQSFHPGIRFCTTDGQWIVNYPKQHHKNCAAKAGDTSEWFKPTARILKNMRNRMINDGVINADLVSSYYIEGMLCNVPNPSFGVTFQSTVANCLNHLRNARESDLMCANNLRPLVRDGRPDFAAHGELQHFHHASNRVLERRSLAHEARYGPCPFRRTLQPPVPKAA